MSLISQIKDVFKDEPDLKVYDIGGIKILYGVPPVKVVGLQYIFARHDAPRTQLFKCLTGGGTFVSNLSSAAIIEIGVLTGSATCAGIEVMEMTGIPWPIAVTDLGTGGSSSVLASACRRTDTPEWRRGAVSGLSVFTFACARTIISDGLRVLDN